MGFYYLHLKRGSKFVIAVVSDAGLLFDTMKHTNENNLFLQISQNNCAKSNTKNLLNPTSCFLSAVYPHKKISVVQFLI